MSIPTYTPGHINLFRLPPGEDLLVGLYRTCRECGLDFGVFQVTGTVWSATLGHRAPDAGEMSRQVLDNPQDLAYCTGNISVQEGSLEIRAYAVVSDRQGRVSAGELLAAEVFVAEVFLQEIKGSPLVRLLDPETGLHLWPVA